MFKKMATAAAAAAMLLAGTANAAQSLSLANNPAIARVATPAKGNKAAAAISPLFIIGGIIGALVILEVTGAINIIEDDPDSP